MHISFLQTTYHLEQPIIIAILVGIPIPESEAYVLRWLELLFNKSCKLGGTLGCRETYVHNFIDDGHMCVWGTGD